MQHDLSESRGRDDSIANIIVWIRHTLYSLKKKLKTTIKKKQFTGLHFVLKLVGISYNTLLKIICYNKVKL